MWRACVFRRDVTLYRIGGGGLVVVKGVVFEGVT